MNLFQELRRRNVFKVATVYVVTSWLLLQVASILLPTFEAPSWVMKSFTVLLVFGFIISLVLAWAFEMTPEGLKRESQVEPEESIADITGRKLDFAIIGLLAIALVYFIYESRFEVSAPAEVVSHNKLASSSTQEKTATPLGTSIAVLPFVNISSDIEQEYFSDGISEEILNVLAKIPTLHVTSRSSAFYFKGKEIIVSEVAKKLGVKHILEGSVRKSGKKIRITAQLIDAESDKHLWSDTYDRDMTDIFVVQDEISAAIVAALSHTLGLDASVTSRDMSKINLDAHNEYLQGRFYIENRNQEDIETALLHFNNAIDVAPDYAPAWMGIGWANTFLSDANYGNIPREEALHKARVAIEKALALAPDMPEAHAIMGLIEVDSQNSNKAIGHFQTAIALNPNYADAISWYGNFLSDQPAKRLELYRKAIQLSPMSILVNSNYADELIRYGNFEEALAIIKHMQSVNPVHQLPFQLLGDINRLQGDYAKSIVAFEHQIKLAPNDMQAKWDVVHALAAIGLNEKAANLLVGTVGDAAKHLYRGNIKDYIKQLRESFPRNENDSLGNWVRAHAEAVAENYQEAIRYYQLVQLWEETGNELIYSYQQIGNTTRAKSVLEKSEAKLQLWQQAGYKFYNSSRVRQPIEMAEMEFAYLEGDTDKAIAKLKSAMAQNYVILFDYKIHPMYRGLREHKDWPDILAESDKRAAIQRELYLKLKAQDRAVASSN